MVADTALTGSALIKALKAPKEDPERPKIDLATEAWNDTELHIPRKAEVLADWVLEAWGRSKASKDSPLLNPKYHRLLVAVAPSCPVPPSAQIGILAAYVQAAAKAGREGCSEELGDIVGISFPMLLRGQKAEAWAEQWGKLVDVLAEKDVPVEAVRPVVELVCEQLASSLSGTPNAKKIANSLHSHLPAYAQALCNHESLRPTLESLSSTLLFPISVLQTVEPLKVAVGALLGQKSDADAEQPKKPITDPRPILAAIPHLFSAFVDSTLHNRYSLYGKTSSDRPIDVIVADRVRSAIITGIGACLDLVNSIESQLKIDSSAAPMLQAIWAARLALWRRLQQWGGYLESDANASGLLTKAARQASHALSQYGASEPNATDQGIAGPILRTLTALEQLNHDLTALDTSVVAWCLASPPRVHVPARELLTALLKFHSLTHSLPKYFDLITKSLEELSDAKLPQDALDALYVLVATGPLVDRVFQAELSGAVRLTNLGGRRGATWASLLSEISSHVKSALGDKVAAASARLIGELGRLTKIVLDAGAVAKSGDDEIEGVIGEAAKAYEVPQSDEERPKKKRRSDVRGGDAQDYVNAARLRVARSARLLGAEVNVSGALAESKSALPELRFETFQYLYTALALSPTDSEAVDTVLSILDHKSVAWSGRDATVTKDSLAAAAWTIVAELGISVLDAAGDQQQLEKLAEIILSRAQPVATIDEFSTPVALSRILSTAETWELPNLRSALLKALVGASSSKSRATGTFTVLTACPAQWLSKGARNQLLQAAYQLDAQLDGTERAVVRSWLARLASVDVFGPLDYDTVKTLDKTSEGCEDETAQLLSLAFTHFIKSFSTDPKPLEKVVKAASSFPSKSFPSRRTVQVLLSALSSASFERLSSLKDKLISVESAVRKALEPEVKAALGDPADKTELFATWRALEAYSRWLGLETNNTIGRDLLRSLLANPGQVQLDLASAALELSSGLDVLAAYIVLPLDLDEALSRWARRLDAASYSEALDSLIPLIQGAPSDTERSRALRAVRILLSVPVEGSGRVIATALPAVLLAVDSAARSSSASVVASALAVLNALVSDRIGVLRVGDVAQILSTLAAVIAPDASKPASPTPELFALALSPLVALVRHRPELLPAQLPALVGVLASFFALLQRPRGTLAGSAAAKAKARARQPFWTPTAEAEGDAHQLARALTALSTARLKQASGEAKSLAAPLAKHAPALLVAYSRAASDAWMGLTPGVRRALEQGLFSVCDVVTAGGRADGRGREGEGVGVPFGLGEGNGEAEWEVWRRLWTTWARKRYTGRG